MVVLFCRETAVRRTRTSNGLAIASYDRVLQLRQWTHAKSATREMPPLDTYLSPSPSRCLPPPLPLALHPPPSPQAPPLLLPPPHYYTTLLPTLHYTTLLLYFSLSLSFSFLLSLSLSRSLFLSLLILRVHSTAFVAVA